MKIELINSYKQKKYVEAKYIAKKILGRVLNLT